jgi:hypothetical protein
MYNRLLFDCPQVSVDVIFAAVSNQCPQRPPEGKLFPYPQVAAEGLIEIRKEAFLKELVLQTGLLDLKKHRMCDLDREVRFLLTWW